MVKRRSDCFAALLIFCGGIILFTAGQWPQEIIGFESRFYLFALEMWRHGWTWFPTTYQQPYPDYPVTSTVFIYLIAKLIGVLNKLTAILPSACAAAFTLAITYLIGALHHPRWGRVAAGFLLFTLAFLTAARTISLDMYVTACTTAIFYFIYAAKLNTKPLPKITILFFLIMSLAVRGPIGLIIPMSVMSSFFLIAKEWRLFFLWSVLGGMLLISGIIGLLLLAQYAGGKEFMHTVLQMEILGRIPENKTPPWYFYYRESLGAYAVTYPLFILLLLGSGWRLWREKMTKQMHFLRLLLAWIAIILLGLSIPGDKKVRYILPIAPALALFCAYLLAEKHTGYLAALKKIFNLFCFIFPSLNLGILAILYHHGIALNYYWLVILLLSLQLSMLFFRQSEARFFLAVLTFFLVYLLIVEKINLQVNQARHFVQQIEVLRKNQQAKLGFYASDPDGIAIKYLINMPQEEQPFFVNDFTHKLPSPSFIIMKQADFNQLSKNIYPIIKKGKIGHDNIVVLKY